MVRLERNIARILWIIMNKFSNKQKPYFIILIVVNKNLEMSFYYTIQLFNLIITLRVKDNREFLLNTYDID